MKRWKKIALIVVGCLIVLLATGIQFTIGWRPFIGPRKRALTNRQFERTPERLARGRYLVRGLLDCEACHSPKEWTKRGAPIVAGKELSGQVIDIPELPGFVVASNLTPDAATGAGRWTDDQLARAIREGIGHDERTLFPMMLYPTYRRLSDEDLASVVVYLRSVPAVSNPLPQTKINFPVNYILRVVPKPVTEPVPGPNAADPLARGKYMVQLGCGCHSAVDALPYAGGEHMKGPFGEVTSANITPDPSGISYYDEATFVKALRTGYVGARELNSIMPFGAFQELTDDDLKAMFAYLRTVPPVRHRVDNSLPPTYCKLCKQKHGAGDQN